MKSELTKRMFSGFKSVCVSLLSWRTVEHKNMNVIFESSSFTKNTLEAATTITIKEIQNKSYLVRFFAQSLSLCCPPVAKGILQGGFKFFNFATGSNNLSFYCNHLFVYNELTESAAFTDSNMLRFMLVFWVIKTNKSLHFTARQIW